MAAHRRFEGHWSCAGRWEHRRWRVAHQRPTAMTNGPGMAAHPRNGGADPREDVRLAVGGVTGGGGGGVGWHFDGHTDHLGEASMVVGGQDAVGEDAVVGAGAAAAAGAAATAAGDGGIVLGL